MNVFPKHTAFLPVTPEIQKTSFSCRSLGRHWSDFLTRRPIYERIPSSGRRDTRFMERRDWICNLPGSWLNSLRIITFRFPRWIIPRVQSGDSCHQIVERRASTLENDLMIKCGRPAIPKSFTFSTRSESTIYYESTLMRMKSRILSEISNFK